MFIVIVFLDPRWADTRHIKLQQTFRRFTIRSKVTTYTQFITLLMGRDVLRHKIIIPNLLAMNTQSINNKHCTYGTKQCTEVLKYGLAISISRKIYMIYCTILI